MEVNYFTWLWRIFFQRFMRSLNLTECFGLRPNIYVRSRQFGSVITTVCMFEPPKSTFISFWSMIYTEFRSRLTYLRKIPISTKFIPPVVSIRWNTSRWMAWTNWESTGMVCVVIRKYQWIETSTNVDIVLSLQEIRQ